MPSAASKAGGAEQPHWAPPPPADMPPSAPVAEAASEAGGAQ